MSQTRSRLYYSGQISFSDKFMEGMSVTKVRLKEILVNVQNYFSLGSASRMGKFENFGPADERLCREFDLTHPRPTE